ncbi:MAG: hypothetical protein KAR06_06980 [Deltaproteobacteria bacterium]|nr:hypothetical protein [Deltaproteobacteria bacterium]
MTSEDERSAADKDADAMRIEWAKAHEEIDGEAFIPGRITFNPADNSLQRGPLPLSRILSHRTIDPTPTEVVLRNQISSLKDDNATLSSRLAKIDGTPGDLLDAQGRIEKLEQKEKDLIHLVETQSKNMDRIWTITDERKDILRALKALERLEEDLIAGCDGEEVALVRQGLLSKVEI